MTLAIAASCGAASAQSNVTIFGVLDAMYERVNNSGGASVTRLANSGLQTTRLGFRGVEDLGGGLSASFWLEGAVSVDDGRGAATNTNNQPSGGAIAGLAGGQGFSFNRRSTVSLTGTWGEARLGRDYNPGSWNLVVFDPFSNLGAGGSQAWNSIITGPTALRVSNTVSYWTPANLGGFYGHVMYWMGENASSAANAKDGTGAGARVGYSAGPADVALAVSRTHDTAGDIHQDNLGGSWNFGMAKVMAMVSRDRNAVRRGRGTQLGVIVPFGASEFKVAYSRYSIDTGATNPEASKISLGYVHNLSKRTALYAAYGRVSNKGGSNAPASFGAPNAIADGDSSAYNLGIRHAF